MALPAGLNAMGTLKGAKGDTGTISYATAETIPAGAAPSVEMVGTEAERGAHFKIPAGAPGVNAVENDTAVAAYLGSDVSNTNAAARELIQQQVFVVDTDFATLEDAFAATAAGGTLEVRNAHVRAAAFVVSKPAIIRFAQGGSITVSSASVAAIEIASSDVVLDSPVLVGTGGNASGLGDGIRSQATVEAPYSGVEIRRPKISEFSKHGIFLEHVHNFRITDVDISRCAYAGVMLASVVRGSVSGGLIKDILQPAGFVNSYGVAVSRISSGSITGAAPRSRDVIVEDLTVDGVLNWEALDTHAGENITFRKNTIYNARTGIAIIGSKDETNTGTVYAPINCSAVNNTLRSGRSDGGAGIGIQFAGAADTLGAAAELATGYVTGNIIRDYGAEGSVGGSSVQLMGTAGVQVSDNTIINSGYSAIDFYHDNFGAKASGNTIIDVWSQTATCYAVQLRSGYNTLSVAGTTIVRSSKAAPSVNLRGLLISANTTNVVRDGGGNDWAAATALPTVGDALTSEMRNYAKKVGLYGATPVVRAAAIPSPAADTTALKTAIDAIRTVIKDIGLTF